MKLSRFPVLRSLITVAALGSATVATTAFAAEDTQPAGALDPYTTAVRAYVSAATKEVGAVRSELNANEKLGKKERYAPVRKALESCETLVSRLKNAGPGKFDDIKSEYERSRADLLQKLNTARQG